MSLIIFLITIEKCPESCKCLSGGAADGGREIDGSGYCKYYCSYGGRCGDGAAYTVGNFIDCTKCKKKYPGNKFFFVHSLLNLFSLPILMHYNTIYII